MSDTESETSKNSGSGCSSVDLLSPGFLPVRTGAVRTPVRSSAGGAVPASRRYQVVQYGGHNSTGTTGTETVLIDILCPLLLVFI
jgi:hypothetical protein